MIGAWFCHDAKIAAEERSEWIGQAVDDAPTLPIFPSSSPDDHKREVVQKLPINEFAIQQIDNMAMRPIVLWRIPDALWKLHGLHEVLFADQIRRCLQPCRSSAISLRGWRRSFRDR
jgi:hypothetical protein